MQASIKSSLRWIATGMLGLTVFAVIGVALVTAALFCIGLGVLATL